MPAEYGSPRSVHALEMPCEMLCSGPDGVKNSFQVDVLPFSTWMSSNLDI